MTVVAVLAEGVTEETFLRDVLAPVLAVHEIWLVPRLIPTSKHGKGGALNGDRVVRYMRNTLLERRDMYVSCFFDLYALPATFPGQPEVFGAGSADPRARASIVEQRLADAVVAAAGCRREKFIPHIQPYEFESLLFADLSRFLEIRAEWQRALERVATDCRGAITPEHINDGATTHPSARLGALKPRYEKVLHGSAIAARIGIHRIRERCPHFDDWINKLENLTPLNPT